MSLQMKMFCRSAVAGLLAMVALETAADRLKTVAAVTQSDTTFSDKLTRLNDTLNALELD